MTWGTLVLLVLVLGGVAWVWYRVNNHKSGAAWAWYKVNNHKSGAVSCCGCGQCARTGECVMVKGKKAVKKQRDPA